MPDAPVGLAAWLRAQFDADEKRLRGGWYSDTHWGMLRTRLRLGAWTVSRENGVDAAMNDRIADAGLAFMRELFDQWQADHAVAWLAEIAAKRKRLAMHRPTSSDVDAGEIICAHCTPTDDHYMGVPWPCDDVLLDAAPYAGRPGWLDEWKSA